jgi:SagB-type dehydrogenase family enzyme
MTEENNTIKLPRPRFTGKISVEQAMRLRRSTRQFRDKPVSLGHLSQLLWAAQGVTGAYNERTAPSAGGTFPLEMYVVAGNVTDLPAGVYKYKPRAHELDFVSAGDRREELAEAAIQQKCVSRGAVAIVLAAVYERTTAEYGERGVQYVHMEIGHVGQNIHLQALSLGLGTVAVGAFEDHAVAGLLGLPRNEKPLYILPLGQLP